MVENLYFDRNDLKSCGENVIIGKTVRIRSPERVTIGDNVIIDDFTYISGKVSIGDYVHVANGCTLSASANSISLAPFSGLSAGCKIYAGSSNYVDCGLDTPTIPAEYSYNVITGDVVLERFSLIGPNGIILPGCRIPEGMSVLPNMVVTVKLKLEAWRLLISNDGKQIKRRGVKKLLEATSVFYKFDE